MVIHSQYAYILKGNAFGKGEKNAEKMRKLRWKEELIHMMDADGDGEVQLVVLVVTLNWEHAQFTTTAPMLVVAG